MQIFHSIIQGPRDYQQDTYIAKDYIWGVFDGMGGHANGHLASEYTRMYVEQVQNPDRQMLSEAFKKAHDACIKARDGRGTTAIVGFLEGNKLIVANTGDSRCSVLRGEELILITQDQCTGSTLWNCLGGHIRDMGFEIVWSEVELQEGDLVFFTTDGLHDYLPKWKLQLIEASQADDPAVFLTEAAKPLTGDNCTAVALRYKE